MSVYSVFLDSRKKNTEDAASKAVKNYQTRISASGNIIPTPDKKLGTTMGNAVNGALDILGRPSQALKQAGFYGARGENPLEAAWKGLSGQRELSGVTIAENLGVKNKAAKFAAGLAIDIGIDPTSYTTLGLGGLAKGFIKGTGAELGAKGLTDTAKYFSSTAREEAKAALMKQHAVNTYEDMAYKIAGKGAKVSVAHDAINELAYGKHFLDVKAAMPDATSWSKFDTAARNYGAEKAAEYSANLKKVAGPGLSVMGKKVVSGPTMQDIGAAARQAITRGTPGVGRAVDAALDAPSALFNTKRIEGVGVEGRDLYSFIKAAAKGSKAQKDLSSKQTFDHIATLMHDARIDGRPLDEIIPDVITRQGIGVPASLLKTVITNNDAKKFAASSLAKNQSKESLGYIADPNNMTVEELANLFNRLYKSMAIEETRAGLLKPGNIDIFSKTAIGSADSASYLPHIMNSAVGDGSVIKGGISKNFNVSSAFARAKNPKYAGQTISEINAAIRASAREAGHSVAEDFNFLETSALKALVSRQLTSNKILADRKFVNTVLDTFGKRIVGTEDINGLRMSGYEIVIPQYSINVLDAGKEGIASLPSQAWDASLASKTSKTVQGIADNYNVLRALDSSQAANFLALKNGRITMYAVPSGIVQQINKAVTHQIDTGMQLMASTIGLFYKAWKPLVTGMRPQYHAVNLASSAFNNYLDLGTRMFKPEVQFGAAQIAAIGRGLTHENSNNYNAIANTVHNLGGKSYKTKDLLDAMVGHNVLSTFFMTDANDMAKNIAKDVADKQGGFKWHTPITGYAKFGKTVGNTTEEYVRAVNFLGNLDKGLTIEQSAAQALKHHFDYQDLTEFERFLKNGVLPFYTWMRKNMPLQVEKFLDDPRIYANFNKAGQDGAQVEGIDFNQIPSYIKKNMPIPFGRGDGDRVRLLDAKLPLSDLQNGVMDVVTGANPLIKAAYEGLSGKSLLTGAPLSAYKEETTVKYLNKYPWLRQSPGMEQFFLDNPGLLSSADYIRNNMGVFRNAANYMGSSDAGGQLAPNKVVHQGQAYTPLKNKYLRSVSQMLDPNFTKYYDPAIQKRNDEYAYSRQLGNAVQMIEGLGGTVPTLSEIKKRNKTLAGGI